MRLPAFVLTLLFPAFLCAGVYKWIGADGRVYYSDQPAPGAERINVTDGSKAGEETRGQAEAATAELGPYTGFELANPEPNATIRDPEGKVPVGILIDPPLMSGHRLEIELDGQRVPGELTGTQLTLRGISFGSHRIQAVVVDELEAPIARTAIVDFHLRKPLPESALP